MTRWLAVWTRAVIGPASRRASGVWIGTGLVGGLVFGPTGMHPRDFTELALHVPAVGGVVALTWILLFVPIARLLVRAEGGSYLRSLPSPRWEPIALAAAAMVGLQLPWLVLWWLGDGVRGLAVVAVVTLVIAAIATWQPPRPRAGWPSWRRDRAALRGVYVRALRRRAGDALVRGLGLAVLAGLAAGLVVRNNTLAGERGGVLGAGTIAIVLAPGWVGSLFPLLEAHRASAWLAASLGITEAARTAVLATIVAGVYAIGAVIAALASSVMGTTSLAWLAPLAVVTSIGMGLVAARAVVWAERSEAAATPRIVIGAIVATSIAIICLAAFGSVGALAVLVIGVAAVLA